MVIAIALPLLLAVALAAVAISVRLGVVGEPPAPDTSPLAVVPVESPAASDPSCVALLAALPPELPAADAPLRTRPLADPAAPGVRAWAAAPRPAVLRCGLPRPVELTPTSALLQINGVSWLSLTDPVAQPEIITYVTVDRPVYVVFTAPSGAGSGPIQAVSDAVRTTLPATAIAVR
jgi:Protein of unknown function (DUF3515)